VDSLGTPRIRFVLAALSLAVLALLGLFTLWPGASPARAGQQGRAFRQELEHRLSEDFVLRKQGLAFHHGLLWDLFRTAPTDRVWRGRNGWLFLAHDHEPEAFRAEQPFSTEALAGWQRFVEQTHAWASARGITFLVAVVPDKSTTYPEELPGGVAPVGAKSRLDQLAERLGHHPAFLDLRPAFNAAKPAGLLYRRYDTHWTGLGTHVAYRGILEGIRVSRPALPRPRDLSEFRVRRVTRTGDLGEMLNLWGGPYESYEELVPEWPLRLRASTGGEPLLAAGERGAVSFSQPSPATSLVLYRDSFGTHLAPLLADHFGKTEVHWSRVIDFDLVERAAPQVLVLEMVERYLQLPEIPASPLDRAVDASDECGALPAAAAGTGGSPVAGVVEQVTARGGQLQVHGWAVDARAGRPAASVLVCWGGRGVRVVPRLPRPDLARAWKTEQLAAGFRAELPLTGAVPESCAGPEVFATDGQGERGRLPAWGRCTVEAGVASSPQP
jgi:hypothetical protein